MDQLNPESRRRAEEAAAHVIDDAGSDQAVSTPAVPTDSAERSLYLRHLFVHGLLESLADEGSGVAAKARDRRVTGVLSAINADRAGGPVARPRLGWRRLTRPLAAAAAVLVIVAGAIAVFSGRGLEARAAVKYALAKVDDGLDRQYSGRLTLRFQQDGKSIERAFRSEFTSRGRDRFHAVVEFPFGPLGAVPVHFGRVGDAVWIDAMGMGARRLGGGSRPMPLPMNMKGNPFEAMTNLGSLLQMMDEHCDVEWETVDEDGPLRIVGTPAANHDPDMPPLESVLVEVARESYEVRAIELRFKPTDEQVGPMTMMIDVPRDAKLAAVTARLEYVKSYRAPDETYWPEELGDPTGDEDASGRKDDQAEGDG